MIPSDNPVPELETLKAERKFDAWEFYPGAPDEAVRARCEARVNELLDALIRGWPQQTTTDLVLSKFREYLPNFDHEDTEERERACGYCEKIMAILGIESSQGVLNNWLYGFDPNELP